MAKWKNEIRRRCTSLLKRGQTGFCLDIIIDLGMYNPYPQYIAVTSIGGPRLFFKHNITINARVGKDSSNQVVEQPIEVSNFGDNVSFMLDSRAHRSCHSLPGHWCSHILALATQRPWIHKHRVVPSTYYKNTIWKGKKVHMNSPEAISEGWSILFRCCIICRAHGGWRSHSCLSSRCTIAEMGSLRETIEELWESLPLSQSSSISNQVSPMKGRALPKRKKQFPMKNKIRKMFKLKQELLMKL